MKRRSKLFIAVAVAIATVLLGTTPARLAWLFGLTPGKRTAC